MSDETKRVGQLYREKLVDLIKSNVNENNITFVVNYSNLTSLAVSEFRKDLQKAGAQAYVTKNTLSQLALRELGHEKLAERIEGQSALVFSNEDSVMIAKVLVNFAKDLEAVSIPVGLLDGKELEEGDIKRLSDLPSKDVLRAQLLAIIQAPITRLLGAFNAKSQDLLSILKQYAEKKGGN